MRARLEAAAPAIGASLLLLGTVAGLYGGLRLQPGGIAPPLVWVPLTLGAVAAYRGRRWPTDMECLGAAAAVLVVVLASGASQRTFFHLTAREFHTHWPYFLLVGVLVARWLAGAPDRRAPWLVVAAQIVLTTAFFDATQWAIPTRDDHPSFLYRFYLLRETFPALVFYNPQWNAGYIAYEMVATGALSPFLLGLPFIYLGEITTLFAAAIPYFFVVVLPWIFYGALRILGARRAAAALGTLVALCPTAVVFLYVLRFGIYPFVISCTMAVLAVALFRRLFIVGTGGAAAVAGLVTATSLCLFWPLGSLMLAPVVVAFLIAAPSIGRRGWLIAGATAVALAVINVPWIVALARYGESARFIVEQKSQIAAAGVSWWDAVVTLRRLVEELHPVTLVLVPVAIVSLMRREASLAAKVLLPSLVAWNLVVAVLGPQVKEQVALERFSVSFALFAAAAAGLVLDRLFDDTGRPGWTLAAGVIVGTIAMTIVNAAGHYQNRGHYRMQVLSPALSRTIETIRSDCPVDRRVLVPGFSLHWFGGGHIASLPLLAERSFVGNDFYHRRDYNDAVPPEYRKGDAFGRFLELYDVGCVLTWNEPWKEAVASFPRAKLVREEEGVGIFVIDGPGSRFLLGSGMVREELDRVVVETESDDVVIKYRFTPGLRTIPAVDLQPYPVYGATSFIRLRPNGARRIVIQH